MDTKHRLTVIIDVNGAPLDAIDRTWASTAHFGPSATVLAAPLRETPLPSGLAVIREPFIGHLTSWRNRVLEHVTTDWVLWLYGGEHLDGAGAARMMRAVRSDEAVAYRLKASDIPRSLERTRLFQWRREIRFGGRVRPHLGGPLAEFGYERSDLDVFLRQPDGVDASTIESWIDHELLALEDQDGIGDVARAVWYWSLGRDRESRLLVKTLRREGQDNETLVGLEATQEMERANPKEAVRICQEYVSIHGESRALWYLLGEALGRVGDHKTARMAYEVSMGDDPYPPWGEAGIGSYRSRLAWARAELRDGATAQGVARLLRLLEQYPRFRPAWQWLLAAVDSPSAQQTVEALGLLISPYQMRQHFMALTTPTPEEQAIQDWYLGGKK